MAKSTDATGLLALDEDECWRFLERHTLGRVAVVHFGDPVVFPVNYALDGRSIVFRTGPGTKLAFAAQGRSAGFEVDEADELFESGTSVVVHGRLHRVIRREELTRLDGLGLRAWAPGDRDHYVRVTASRVTGRRIAPRVPEDGVTADGG
jgi:nitroimidazol reductase NimA-like FMN-containing flavoprotein (pyridoxamine 5'-phosphate oxidase superfamily)